VAMTRSSTVLCARREQCGVGIYNSSELTE
jgi:hypothetical protein